MTTKTEVEKYLSTLDPCTAKIFSQAELVSYSIRDTLTDDYQIAAQVLDIFYKMADKDR